MASLTRSQLKTSSDSTYDTNGVGGITAAEVRTFNDDLIDSLITNDLTGAMSVASASNALTASSVANGVLTPLNQFTASATIRLNNLETTSASVNVSISNLNAATSSYAISASVAAVDASQQQQINSLIAASSSYANSASFAASQLVQDGRLNNLESTSASLLIETQNLELFSASALVSINNLNAATQSYVTETESGSFLITASVNLNTITFTKGDGTTFPIIVNTGSAVATINTGSFATTGSNAFNGSQNITGSLTSSLDIRVAGVKMGFGNQSGTASIAIGTSTLLSNTGDYNIAVGFNAGLANTTGGSNTMIGRQAMEANTTGYQNTALGYAALQGNTTANTNTGIGAAAGRDNQTGAENVFVGYIAGFNSGNASNNVVIGARAGQSVKSSSNTIVGHGAATNITSGSSNTIIGKNAAVNGTTILYNTIIGETAATNISTGNNNTIIGQAAGVNVGSGSNNLFIGQNAGRNISGSNNVVLGHAQGVGSWNNVIALSDGSQNIRAIYNSDWVLTGSVDIQNTLTASLQQGFTYVGNASGRTTAVSTSSFASTIDTGSFATTASFNSYTQSTNSRLTNIESTTASLLVETQNLELFSASALVSLSNLNTTTASLLVETQNLELFSASALVSINSLNSATASYVTETESGSFLLTASFDNGTRNLTFTKGDASTFAVNIPDVSGSTINTGSFATTASFNAYTQSNDQRVSSLESNSASVNTSISNINQFTSSANQRLTAIETVSGSWITESETASFARTNVDNNFTANQTFTNITAVSASFTYVQTLYETASVIYSSGSNQFGDELSDIQTLSGSVKVQGSLTVNGTPVLTSSVDISGLTTTASFNAYTQSNDQKVNSLINATASYATSAITASSLITASASGNTITFTKGDASTFNVSVDTGSAATTIFEVVYTGENITKGDPLYISGSQGANPIVFKADAAIPAKMPVTFVANETIAVANTTDAIVLGLIEGIDLTGYVAGQSIYVAEGGGWSANLPSGSNSVTQLLGVVTKGGSGGKGLVLNPGPAQLPGLDNGYMWVGNGNNQPIEITTASFASSASFNSYTASTNSKLTNIETTTASLLIETQNLELFSASALTSLSNLNTATSSLFTSASLSLTTASVSGQTMTFTKGDGTTFNVTLPAGSGSAIDTGSFATTGSNTFTGDQTLVDNAGNFFTISDASGSLMLVAKGFTSASAHMSASAAGIGNIIFKTNSNTADTIISGSANLFVNPAAATSGFKRYIGGSGNVALNASNVPQISGSMQFSPTINTNFFGGNNVTITARGPVSSSAWTISGNSFQGAVNIGQTAANHAQGLVSGLNMLNNVTNGAIAIIANKANLTQTLNVSQNSIGGTLSLTAASSSISWIGNTSQGTVTLTNEVSGSGATVVSSSNAVYNSQNIIGGQLTINASGNELSDDPTGQSYLRSFERNIIAGNNNIVRLDGNTTSTLALTSTAIIGNNLIITGSSASRLFNTAGVINYGSAFFGRFNAVDGNRAKSGETVFAVGTGTGTSSRKTGFLIDSGSNSFFEGTVNISGSLLVNGVAPATINTASLATTGSNLFIGNQTITGSVSIKGNTTFTSVGGNQSNIILGANALGNATTANNSVAIGEGALNQTTTGANNFALGNNAMYENITGYQNVALGVGALYSNVDGYKNIAIGNDAGIQASGSQNTYIGAGAGQNITGSNNTIIGAFTGTAGSPLNDNIILADGSGNVKAQYSGSAWSFQDNIKFNKGSNKTCDIVDVNTALTVSNSLVTIDSIILVTTQNSEVAGDEYPAVVSSKGSGTFTINHNYGGTLKVAYLIINPT